MQYVLSLVLALALSLGIYGLRLHRAGMKPQAALLSLPVSALLGFGLAKVLYVLLQTNYVWRRWGFASFLRMDLREFSFFGGMAGVLLGVVLVGWLLKLPLRRNMDAFAPGMALLCGLGKFAEFFLGDFGSGSYVENEAHQFFPLAIVNEWEEWYYAVFMLAGLCGLIVFVVSLLRSKRHADVPGMLFGRTAFYLALPMVLCESLRTECMRWGFVKCEQVLCAVTIGAAIFALCWGIRVPHSRRWLPIAGVLVIVAGLVAVEFMLDKLSYPEYVGYSIMLTLLALLALLESLTVRRRRRNG